MTSWFFFSKEYKEGWGREDKRETERERERRGKKRGEKGEKEREETDDVESEREGDMCYLFPLV